MEELLENSDLNGSFFKNFIALETSDKFLLLGNLTTIVGIGLVSAGTVIRMLKEGALPGIPVFNINNQKVEGNKYYKGSNYFTS